MRMAGKFSFRVGVALVPLLLVGAAAPTTRHQVEMQRCTSVDLSKTRPLLDSLFSDYPETRGVLLLVDGCPAYKSYEAGYSDANRMISWSMAKTVTAMLVGQLVADGKLQLDAPAPIAEWHNPGDPRAAITLADLMHMASGLRNIEVGDPIEDSDTNQVLFVSGTQNMAARAIAAPLQYKPGTHFEYSSLTTIILAEIVARTLTDSHDPHERARIYDDFAQTRLFGPAGVKSAFLEYDGAGTQIGGSIMHMTLDDWGRLGTLLIDGKAQDGTQIIDPAWLKFMKTPSPAYAGYGGQTWLNYATGNAEPGLFPGQGPMTTVGMRGHLGQFIAAVRGTGIDGKPHSVVVVRLGHTNEDTVGPVLSTVGAVVQSIIPAGETRPQLP